MSCGELKKLRPDAIYGMNQCNAGSVSRAGATHQLRNWPYTLNIPRLDISDSWKLLKWHLLQVTFQLKGLSSSGRW